MLQQYNDQNKEQKDSLEQGYQNLIKESNIIKEESLKVKMENEAIKLENKMLKNDHKNAMDHSALIK